MTSNLKLASFSPAIIMLVATLTISVSAQTPGSVNISTPKTASTLEPREKDVEKLASEKTELTAGPIEESVVNPRAEVSNSVRAHDGSNTADRADEERVTNSKPGSANTQTTDSDNWQFQFSPYFWLASLHGTAGVGNRTTEVDESFSDIFHSLKFALMGVLEARKGKLVLLTDMEYISIEDEKATPGPFFSDVNAKFKLFIFDPELGYRVYDDSDTGASVDVLGGIRVWHLSTELDFGAGILPATQVQGSRTWVDAIVGLRGRAPLSEKVFVTGKFDLGGGGSKFTWQLFGGLGYSITPKIALIGGYRVLDVNYNKDNFIYDMNQRGPIVGLGFKF